VAMTLAVCSWLMTYICKRSRNIKIEMTGHIYPHLNTPVMVNHTIN